MKLARFAAYRLIGMKSPYRAVSTTRPCVAASAFDPANPLDPTPARRYRDSILRPGGSRPAARLIEDFLGRPFGFASWQQWVEEHR